MLTKNQKIEQLKHILKNDGDCPTVGCFDCVLHPHIYDNYCTHERCLSWSKELLSKLTRAPRTKVRRYSEKELRKSWVVRFKNAGHNYKIFIQELRKGARK
jgi:hypothetical protein